MERVLSGMLAECHTVLAPHPLGAGEPRVHLLWVGARENFLP